MFNYVSAFMEIGIKNRFNVPGTGCTVRCPLPRIFIGLYSRLILAPFLYLCTRCEYCRGNSFGTTNNCRRNSYNQPFQPSWEYSSRPLFIAIYTLYCKSIETEQHRCSLWFRRQRKRRRPSFKEAPPKPLEYHPTKVEVHTTEPIFG